MMILFRKMTTAFADNIARRRPPRRLLLDGAHTALDGRIVDDGDGRGWRQHAGKGAHAQQQSNGSQVRKEPRSCGVSRGCGVHFSDRVSMHLVVDGMVQKGRLAGLPGLLGMQSFVKAVPTQPRAAPNQNHRKGRAVNRTESVNRTSEQQLIGRVMVHQHFVSLDHALREQHARHASQQTGRGTPRRIVRKQIVVQNVPRATPKTRGSATNQEIAQHKRDGLWTKGTGIVRWHGALLLLVTCRTSLVGAVV